MNPAIGKRNVPKHFHDLQPPAVIERAFQHARKMVEIDRLTIALLGSRGQPGGCRSVKAEPLFDDLLQLAPLGKIHPAVRIGDMDQQGNGRKTIIILVEGSGGGVRSPISSTKRFRASNIKTLRLEYLGAL
jgi:hypothetical protein